MLVGNKIIPPGSRRVYHQRSVPRHLSWFGKASISLNAMVDEYFGINIVEFMVGSIVVSRSSQS